MEADKPVGSDRINLTQLWPRFVETMIHDRPHIGSFLSLAHIVASGETSLEIQFGVEFKFQFGEITKKGHRDEIVKKLSDLAGTAVDLRITISTEPSSGHLSTAPTVTSTQPEAPVHVSISDAIEQEPVIQKVLDVFDAEVI